MTRTQNPSTSRGPISTRVVAICLAALLGIAACGSDDDSSSTDQTAGTDAQESSTDSGADAVDDSDQEVTESDSTDATLPDISLPAGVTLPAGASIPELTEDCLNYLQVFASAFTGDASALGDVDDALGDLESRVPEELQEDFAKVSVVLSKLVEVSKENEGNPTAAYSDPDLIALFSDPEFTAAADRINTWLSTECGVED